MSSELQFNQKVCENSYDRYKSYHCNRCDMNVLMNQLADHVANKHGGLEFGPESSNGTDDDDVSSMDNGIGRKIASKNKSTKVDKSSTFEQDYAGKQYHVAAAATAVSTQAVGAVAQTSGDETDFLPFHPNLTKKKGLFEDDDYGITTTSTPNTRSTARSMTRNRMQTVKSFYNGSAMNNGGEMAQKHHRGRIPTAHELFDYSRSQSEFRDGHGGGGCGGAVDNGDDGDKARRYGFKYNRRSAPVQRVIPENFQTCQYCKSVMHQDYIRGHIERKHGPTGNDGNINGAIVGKIEKTNEPIFVRCQLCSAHMHINCMPLHLVRKHRTEYDGSAGFVWIQGADNQVNQLLSSNRVYVKNGAVYIKDLE